MLCKPPMVVVVECFQPCCYTKTRLMGHIVLHECVCVYEQSLLQAIHDQSEQMLSIKAEKNNYRKAIVIETTRGGRLFIGLMKIDSAMKEVQKSINRATKKKTKMLKQQAKILVKLKKVEEKIERIQGEIVVIQEEIKVYFDRLNLTCV